LHHSPKLNASTEAMESIRIQVRKESEHPLPEHATIHSAGVDLRAALESPITLAPMERKLIPTGLYLALPEGTEAQIRPRSGLAYKKGITVLNAPGTIDADYRGEVKVLLVNLSNEDFRVEDGERIAQMVVARYAHIEWESVQELEESVRGAGGFGHTGQQ